MNALTAAFLSRRGAMRGLLSKAIANMAAQSSGPGSDYAGRGGRFDDDTCLRRRETAEPLRRRIHFSPVLATPRFDAGQWPTAWHDPRRPDGNSIESTDAAFPLNWSPTRCPAHADAHRPLPVADVHPGRELYRDEPVDATARRLRTGDRARLTSATSPEELRVARSPARLRLMCGGFAPLRDSVVPRHRVNGGTPLTTSTRRGHQCQPGMRADPVLSNVTLQDKLGGSSSFYDTRVDVQKVA